MLNNKGMTTVEILMVFVIIGIISVGLFSMISSFNNKQNVESAKEKLMTFKNTVTRDIEGDIIRKGLVSVRTEEKHLGNANQAHDDTYIAHLTFKDGTTKDLTIHKVFFEGHDGTKTEDSKDFSTGAEAEGQNACLTGVSGTQKETFTISYGAGSEIELYELPDLGSSTNECEHLTKDLRLNDIDISTKNNILNIYIGFYHPDLSTRYAINIICPINFDDINSTYSDNPYAETMVQLKNTVTARGNAQTNDNNSPMNRPNVIVGKVTLEEEVTLGTTSIKSNKGIVCNFYKGDGSTLATNVVPNNGDTAGGLIRVSDVTKNGSIVTKATFASKIPSSTHTVVLIRCSAKIEDSDGIVKEEKFEDTIGNGWQEGPLNVTSKCATAGKYNEWYYYQNGEQLKGGWFDGLWWFNPNIPNGQSGKYYFFTGGDELSCTNGNHKVGTAAIGWCKNKAGKWYYFKDGCSTGDQDNHYFLGQLITNKTMSISSGAGKGDFTPYTFDNNGICTNGNGC